MKPEDKQAEFRARVREEMARTRDLVLRNLNQADFPVVYAWLKAAAREPDAARPVTQQLVVEWFRATAAIQDVASYLAGRKETLIVANNLGQPIK